VEGAHRNSFRGAESPRTVELHSPAVTSGPNRPAAVEFEQLDFLISRLTRCGVSSAWSEEHPVDYDRGRFDLGRADLARRRLLPADVPTERENAATPPIRQQPFIGGKLLFSHFVGVYVLLPSAWCCWLFRKRRMKTIVPRLHSLACALRSRVARPDDLTFTARACWWTAFRHHAAITYEGLRLSRSGTTFLHRTCRGRAKEGLKPSSSPSGSLA